MAEKYTFGLIDWELLVGASGMIFNIDLMRTSTYLKNEGKFVQLITHFNPSLLTRYGKVYIFKDVDDGFYPKEFFCAPNVEVIGRASGFSTDLISPEVRLSIPDQYIYLNAKRYFNYKTADTEKFNKMTEAVHLTLLDNSGNLSDDWQLSFKGVGESKQWRTISQQIILLHDPNIVQLDGSYSAVNEALYYKREQNKPHHIWFKYPLHCKDDEEFLKWRSIFKDNLLTRYILNYIPPLDTLIQSVTMKQKPEYRVQSVRGGENSVIYMYIQPDFPPAECLERLYDLMLFGLFGRGHRTQIQVILPSVNYLGSEWYSFVKVLNDFWLTVDEISLSGRGMSKISFKEFATRNYEVGPKGLTLARNRPEAAGVNYCRQLLYNQNHDFFRLLYTDGYLEYDSQKKEFYRGGPHDRRRDKA